jgi:hypothetical protein
VGAADAVETFEPLRAICYLPLGLTFTTQATVAALQPLLRISRGFVAFTEQIGQIVWVLLGFCCLCAQSALILRRVELKQGAIT